MAEEESSPVHYSTDSLYNLSVSAVAERFLSFKKYLCYLPENVLFDLYYQLYKEKRLCLLGVELCKIKILAKLLKVTNRRVHLLQIFQALMDHDIRVNKDLVMTYERSCFTPGDDPAELSKVIKLGLLLGGFLSDAGWYEESKKVLSSCKELCLNDRQTPENWCRTLDCCYKLLHAQATYCDFQGAAETRDLATKMVEKLKEAGYQGANHAALYAEFSVLYFFRSEYDQAYRWSMEALKQLTPNLPARLTIDVLRQAAKSCVIKRDFQKAGLLIRQAVYLAREVFEQTHPKYSDVLIDYGFYLLNYDSVIASVSVYKTALEIKKTIFGRRNLHIAIAHEELAYALYVHDYSSGKFEQACDHAIKAISIMERLLPAEHLMLASAKRVKALILEEIALDHEPSTMSEDDLLLQSESLHLSALQLAKTAFGERNVQTAKHYGNLGRLYQSMKRFQDAEDMHLKAISIKEELLGSDDYEVGLSIGHLASLYNFHMNRFKDAEKLYHRSIAISLKLFGKSYSGLEYDYRGLLHVYEHLDEYAKMQEYHDTFTHWKELREDHARCEDPPIDLLKGPQPIREVIQAIFAQ